MLPVLLANTQNDCHQWLSNRVHKIRFWSGLCPGHHWESLHRSPRPHSWIYGGPTSKGGEGIWDRRDGNKKRGNGQKGGIGRETRRRGRMEKEGSERLCKGRGFEILPRLKKILAMALLSSINQLKV